MPEKLLGRVEQPGIAVLLARLDQSPGVREAGVEPGGIRVDQRLAVALLLALTVLAGRGHGGHARTASSADARAARAAVPTGSSSPSRETASRSVVVTSVRRARIAGT